MINIVEFIEILRTERELLVEKLIDCSFDEHSIIAYKAQINLLDRLIQKARIV